MTDTDSVRIPGLAAALAAETSTAAKRALAAHVRVRRLIAWGLAGTGLGTITVIILARNLALSATIDDPWLHTINSLALTTCVAGLAAVCSGLVITSVSDHIRLAKLETAAQHLRVERQLDGLAEQLRAAAPTEALGQLAAEQESVRALVLDLGAQVASRKDIEGLRRGLDELKADLDRAASVLVAMWALLKLAPEGPLSAGVPDSVVDIETARAFKRVDERLRGVRSPEEC